MHRRPLRSLIPLALCAAAGAAQASSAADLADQLVADIPSFTRGSLGRYGQLSFALPPRVEQALPSFPGLNGRVYHVNSQTGSDAANGLQAEAGSAGRGPWRSLAKLRSAKLQPGDRVVLACNSVWRETLQLGADGHASAPIVVGAPDGGCAVPPTIDGAITIEPSAWTAQGNGRFSATLRERALLLTSNDKGAGWRRAHHPNFGIDASRPASPFLPLAADSPVETVNGRPRSREAQLGSLASLPAGAQLTAGLTLHVRSNAWTIEELPIASVSGSRVQFSGLSEYPIKAGWGWFLSGASWMVDSPWEWHHDEAAGRLLIAMPSGWRPVSRIFAGTLPVGIELSSRRHIVVHGLALRHLGTGVVATNSENVQLHQLAVRDIAGEGVSAPANRELTVAGSAFYRTGRDAIRGYSIVSTAGTRMRVLDNVIRETGIRIGAAGVDSLPVKSYAAIETGDDSEVSGNVLLHAGYIGIRFRLRNLIERNLVISSCKVLDDCGAIYTWSPPPGVADTSKVLNNVVIQALGNTDGKPANAGSAAQGIYLDDFTDGVTVDGNTVIDADHGIQVHSARRNLLSNNRLYGNRRSQIWFQENTQRTAATGDVYGNRVQGNVLVPTLPGSSMMLLDTLYADTGRFASFRANHYLGPAYQAWISERIAGQQSGISGTQWTQRVARLNASADGGDALAAPMTDFRASGSNLVDPMLTSGSNAWGYYSASAGARLLLQSCNASPCLRYEPSAAAGLINSPRFSVRENAWYRLSFDLAADQDAQRIDLRVRRGGGGSNGYESLSDRTLAFVASKGWRRYSMVFMATKTVNARDPVTKDNGARIDIEGLIAGRSISIANVQLLPIELSAPSNWTGLLINASPRERLVDCPSAARCGDLRVAGEGRAISWPLRLPAYAAVALGATESRLLDSDRDGIANDLDRCPNTPADLAVGADGCTLGERS